jgi:hypothetical protein
MNPNGSSSSPLPTGGLKAIDAPGVFVAMLCAIRSTSRLSSGGWQRSAFATFSAARISASLMPRRRIVPARLASVTLRPPSGITSPAGAARWFPFVLAAKYSISAAGSSASSMSGPCPSSHSYARPVSG